MYYITDNKPLNLSISHVALAYGCALKPETVVEFVNNNVEILQTVQNKHTEQIKEQQEQIDKLMDMCGAKVSGIL